MPKDNSSVSTREFPASPPPENAAGPGFNDDSLLLSALMEHTTDCIYFKDLESRFVRINRQMARYFRLPSPEAAIGKTDRDFFSDEHALDALRDEQEVIRSGRPLIGKEERETWPDGRITWAFTSKMPLLNAWGEVIGTFGISRDITDRRYVQEALRTSEQRYRELFEHASEIIFTNDLEGRFTSLNLAGERALGYSRREAAQLNLREITAPEYRAELDDCLKRMMAGEQVADSEIELIAKDGRRVRIAASPRIFFDGDRPVGVLAIARDITGRDLTEIKQRQAQKLESVGRLASGIAHEINTPTQFIGDNARFLQSSFAIREALFAKYRELADAAAAGCVDAARLRELQHAEEKSGGDYLRKEIPKAIAQTLQGVERVSTIVRAIKEFADTESNEMAPADINTALQSTITVARNELKYVADVETHFADLPPVLCNIGDLNQVFLNLLVNAAHAIANVVKNGEKGRITLRTACEGDTVLISIADTGSGIPEETRSKIFDPFFTTREVGRGTGQGLAIARSVVVDRHHGALTFDSEVGKGTTFYIRLPIAPASSGMEGKQP